MKNRLIKYRAWDKVEKKMYYGSSGDTKKEFEKSLLRGKYEIAVLTDGSIVEIWSDPTLEVQGTGVVNKEAVRLTSGEVSDALELMQFTGLKDKNGKEIYEGDIVETQPWFYWEKRRIGNVVFKTDIDDDIECYYDATGWFVEWHSISDELIDREPHTLFLQSEGEKVAGRMYEKNIEVIGNIYENPELLKQHENN